MSAEHLKIPVRVSEVAVVNALVTRFSFTAINGAELPTFSGGSHVIVEFGSLHEPVLADEQPLRYPQLQHFGAA